MSLKLQNIPKGYKQTEVGVIPEDWRVEPLNKNIIFVNGKAHEQNIVDFGKYIVINSKFISSDGEVKKYSDKCIQPVYRDNITMVMSDVPNGKAIAKCFYVDQNNTYTLNQRICSMKSISDDSRYLFLQINRNPYFLSFDDGVKQTNLRKDDILKCLVKIPNDINEQKIIANSLLNVQELIEKLEKLIEKKKAIKQGAMQELVTGKKRLPGFSGERKSILLGKSAQIKARIGWQGLTTAEYMTEGDYYLITGTEFDNGFINWDKCFYVDKKRYDQDTYIQIKENDVLITKDGTIGKVAFIGKVLKPATLNSGVFVIRPLNESFHPKFLFYILQSDVFDKFLSQLSAGSTINHLSQKNFVNFNFNAPPSIEEQEAIAKIISEIDIEIVALEQKLIKYRQIKTGMMQQLLTGKIRLVN